MAYANPSASFSVAVVPSGPPPKANFVANLDDIYQTIDGFGGSDAFLGPGAFSGAFADMFYCINATDPGCSNPGIGLTFLRQAAINGSVQADATGVVARGGKVWAIPWTVNNPSDSTTYQASAQALVNWITSQTSAGIPIYAMGSQNEPDCGCNGGNVWSDAQIAAFDDVLGPMLHALSPPVKLISPEPCCAAYWTYPGFVER